MTKINKGTKKAAEIIADTLRDLGSIFEAYGRCSNAKIQAWEEIKERAENTSGYNHDLHVCGKCTSNYSTVYTFTDENGKRFAVKDTWTNTFITEM